MQNHLTTRLFKRSSMNLWFTNDDDNRHRLNGKMFFIL